MIKVAIVDDNKNDVNRIVHYIKEYAKMEKMDIETTTFSDGMEFVSDYKPGFDICIMDIEMPQLDGIKSATRLRQYDKEIVILFVTNMAQYAIKGYEVDAVDFMVKPVSNYNFHDKFKKALSASLKHEKTLFIPVEDGVVNLPIKSIYYIEKQGHDLCYVTEQGTYFQRNNIKDAYLQVKDYGFSICDRGCIVNLSNITKISQNNIFIANHVLPISRGKKKDFFNDLSTHLRGF